MSELTNGFIGYVPTRLAIALGGYGASNRRLDDAAGQMVVKACEEMIECLLKKG